jgi:ABC-2 type transport system permease protein
MKEITNLVWRSVKWRFQNPITIIMTMVQPLMWLLLFANLFNNGDNTYMSFIMAGILVMAILFSSGISGIATYSSKENGSYYRIMIAPVKRISIILAHIIDAIVLSGSQICVLLLLAFCFGVRIKTGSIGVFAMLILLVVTIAFVATLSYLLSTVIPDENGFIAIINTFTLPLFFLSSALVAKEAMSKFFQMIATINPFTYVVVALRNIINDSTINWQTYSISLVIMIILAIIFSFIAASAYGKQE